MSCGKHQYTANDDIQETVCLSVFQHTAFDTLVMWCVLRMLFLNAYVTESTLFLSMSG